MHRRQSTKRQSNLEIRTHQRLLPRKVATSSEHGQLQRKRSQLMMWLSQPENEADRSLLLKMLMKNSKAQKLSVKYYTEKRRKRFERKIEMLRQREHDFIQNMIRSQQRLSAEEDDESLSDEETERQSSIIESLIGGFKYLFCNQN